MCQDDHDRPAAGLPPACCGLHDLPDEQLMELGFQIVYTRLLAAASPHPPQETPMPARAA